ALYLVRLAGVRRALEGHLRPADRPVVVSGSLAQGCENLVRVAVRVHAPHDLRDVAVGVDHERRSLIGALALLPDAVGLAELVLGIGEEREGQRILRIELLVWGRRVGSDREDL